MEDIILVEPEVWIEFKRMLVSETPRFVTVGLPVDLKGRMRFSKDEIDYVFEYLM